jgi:hypothetical protein
LEAEMKILAIVAVAVLCVAIPGSGKDKSPAQCRVYFSVVQIDPESPGSDRKQLDPPQQAWYDKDGNRDKFAGACYDAIKASYIIRWSQAPETTKIEHPEPQPSSDPRVSAQGPPITVTRTFVSWIAKGSVLRVGKDGTSVSIGQINGETHLGNPFASVELLKRGISVVLDAEAKSTSRN